MRKFLLVVALSAFTTIIFAQKKAVKEAKSEAGKNTNEARALIKPALTDPETKNDPETWFVAGDIEYKAFDKEREVEMLKEFSTDKKGGDSETMYNGLYNMFAPYMKADSLGQLPDEKGKVKNKFRKEIIKNLKSSYPYLINAGAYYNDKRDYSRACDFFERYWIMPSLDIFKDDKNDNMVAADSIFQTIKYYAVITSIRSGNHQRAIGLLKNLINEGYISNSTYSESDSYELLAGEYQQIDDSVNYLATLKSGAEKYPNNLYFIPNLINEFIKAGQKSKAIEYIDQAINNNPSNACSLYSVKGTLFIDGSQKDYTQAENAYQQALNVDANCERALEGLGVLYILKAQDMKDKAGQTTNRKEQAELDKLTSDLYIASLPFLEKYYNLLKEKKAEASDLNQILIKLQNVYYNLSLLNIDKSKEYDAVTEELQNLKTSLNAN